VHQPQASGSGGRLKKLSIKLATLNSPSTVFDWFIGKQNVIDVLGYRVEVRHQVAWSADKADKARSVTGCFYREYVSPLLLLPNRGLFVV